jgi:hypothetical protein
LATTRDAQALMFNTLLFPKAKINFLPNRPRDTAECAGECASQFLYTCHHDLRLPS